MSESNIILYTTPNGHISVQVQYEDGSFRLTQKRMAELFDVDFYNLDAIIAVGYRVNSYQATQFRVWATNALKEFIIKGFVIDDEWLKQGSKFDKNYLNEAHIKELNRIVSAYLDLAENGLRHEICKWLLKMVMSSKMVGNLPKNDINFAMKFKRK